MMKLLYRWIASPANWIGLALATAVLVAKGMGLVGATLGLPLVLGGYIAGFVAGGLWLGFPSSKEDQWEALNFKDEGDAREAMGRALSGVRRLTDYNPGGRIPEALQKRVLALCDQLENLLDQWERSKGNLSLQDSFHARHIAIRYLPEALNSYLSIPANFARTQVLANGKTAQTTFDESLAELEGKVKQLGNDLATQDAHAFLVHSKFLKEKFGAAGVKEPVALAATPSTSSSDTEKSA
jgi:non-ribosomal peptide synthetase component F